MATSNEKEKIEQFLTSTPKDIKLYVQHSLDFAYQVSCYLKKNKMTQKDLAKLLRKEESEISKWLSGDHNFTMRSIAKIEAALDKQFIFTREEIVERFLPFITRSKKLTHYEKEKIDELITYYSYSENLEDSISDHFFMSNTEYEIKTSTNSLTELKYSSDQFEVSLEDENTSITPSNNYILTTSLAA